MFERAELYSFITSSFDTRNFPSAVNKMIGQTDISNSILSDSFQIDPKIW